MRFTRLKGNQRAFWKQCFDKAKFGHILDALGIEHAIQVIELMLEDPGVKTLSLAREHAAILKRAAVTDKGRAHRRYRRRRHLP